MVTIFISFNSYIKPDKKIKKASKLIKKLEKKAENFFLPIWLITVLNNDNFFF